MTYRVQPGIVLTKICDQYVLIPTHQASKICPTVTIIPLFSAMIMKKVCAEKDPYSTTQFFSILKGWTEQEARHYIQGILQELCKKGYLIETE